MNYSSSISTISSSTSSFSDLEPSLSQTLTSSHSSSSSKKKNMVKGGVISAGAPSPRSVFCYDSLSDDEPRHFLDSCFLCNKVLSGHKDIFMYEGDKPFCSEDCRQKQIDFDENKEQEEKMKLKLKMKSFYSSSSSIKSFQRSSLIVNHQESTTTTTSSSTNESLWT